jgi:hypothetical protein
MNTVTSLLRRCFVVALILSISAVLAFAQQGRGTLRGVTKDELGSVIVGATVTVSDANGQSKTTTTNGDGVYTFAGLAPGKYSVKATAAGFANTESVAVDIAGARQALDITLKVTILEQKVTVAAEAPLSTEASNNANQTLITGRDLDALPDDPDELAAALQALAGPSVGPNGGQIFIDGFSGGNMPSKDSIREIRINQNPFSAENDQPSARIEILTKPGSDKYRGSASFNFNDESLNSRNPFQTSSKTRTPFQIRQFGGSFSGPLKKQKASFYLEFNRNETNDNDLLRATILDPSLTIVSVGQGLLVPRRFTNFGPRLDYAINPRNTLVARFSYNHTSQLQGLGGGFALPERGYNNVTSSKVFQVTETAVLNATMINETRFQYSHNDPTSEGDNSIPVLNVSSAFSGGSSGVGIATNSTNRWELGNFTSMQKGNHAIKFGGRVRGVSITDTNPNLFGGQWTFNGGLTGLTSIQRYQKTLQLQQAGMTPAQIRAAGGGAAGFSINSGNPTASVSQYDIEPYVQDDWRYRPNLTFSYGLRYEIQNNAHSKLDFAPRVAVAWSPGASDSAHPPKTVIRAGTGIFYNRFNEGSTLQTVRFNGVNQKSFSFAESTNPLIPTDPSTLAVLNSFGCANGTATPDCVTKVASIAGATPQQLTTWRVIPNLQIPTVYVVGGQVERQLPHNFTVSLGAYGIRILHVIRARDINAPLPGTISLANPTGIRPDQTQGEIYQYEASGKFHQEQLFVGFNSRLNPSFSLSGNYVLSKTTNDTDGQGSGLFPRDSYDLQGEFGRGGFDVRHRFFLFGTYSSKIWKLVFSPFVTASSGAPFNILTGVDSNLDRQLTERPSFAGANANCALANIKCTKFGNFNLTPAPGEQIVPRNYGQGTASFVLNMRITRTFGFVNAHKAPASGQAGSGGPGGGPGARGPMIAGGGGAGGDHGPGAGGGMQGPRGGGGGGGASEKKFTLTASLYFQNVLNNVNLAPPIGNLSSPQFGQSQSVAGSFGGFGGGGGGSANAGNRRIYLNLRLNF